MAEFLVFFTTNKQATVSDSTHTLFLCLGKNRFCIFHLEYLCERLSLLIAVNNALSYLSLH